MQHLLRAVVLIALLALSACVGSDAVLDATPPADTTAPGPAATAEAQPATPTRSLMAAAEGTPVAATPMATPAAGTTPLATPASATALPATPAARTEVTPSAPTAVPAATSTITPAAGAATSAVTTTVALALVAEGLTAPVALVEPPDGTGRLFVIDQAGLVRIVSPDGQLVSQPYLDVRDRMVPLRASYDERGLLSLAFHPDFGSNSRFFVYYSARGGAAGADHVTRLSEFQAAGAGAGTADPNSERVILEIPQPQANHEGGTVLFGPDGMLYLSTGDGGGANDVGPGHNPQIGNGQDLTTLLGKVLRLDVNAQEPYGIPEDNPFASGEGGAPEIYAWGLRNPYRMSFDMADGRLYAGDAGQNLYEEVSIIENGGNYGWNIKEGTSCFNPAQPGNPRADCPETGANGEPLIDPVLQYSHQEVGLVVVGGHVYRGSTLPQLDGHYIFGDWSTSFGRPDGALLVARVQDGDDGLWPWAVMEISDRPDGRLGHYLLGLGQDQDGEIYVLTSNSPSPTGTTGRVYRLAPAE
jgi:glucose/arabinose dehydrogenase